MTISEMSGRYTYINKVTGNNEEMIKPDLFDPRFTHPFAKKMSIVVDNECEIIINGLDRILVKPDLGMNIEYEDKGIHSLVAVTPNVQFYSIIAY